MTVAFFAVAFGTNVSTPLLLVYQEEMSLSTWTVTALFAIYPIGLLPSLLWAGPASDAYGRRAVMLPGLVLSALASALFLVGDTSLGVLFAARFLLGAVSGLVFVTASAWMQELGDPENPLWPARLTGMTLYVGFGGGPVVAGVLGQWAPAPLRLSFLVHLALVGVGIVACRLVPETVVADPSRRVRPNLGIPAGTGRAFASVVVPVALSVFGFASMAFGLFPVKLRPAMESVAVLVTGVVGGITAASIFTTQAIVTRLGAVRAAPYGLACGAAGSGLAAVAFATDMWGLLFVAAALLGGGSGLALTSGLRFVDMLTSTTSRGAMTGSFYAVAYAAMTMPVIVSSIGRSDSAFMVVLAAVAVVALLGAVWVRHRADLVSERST